MKIVEDYAQRRVDEALKCGVVALDGEGRNVEEIAKTMGVSIDFVKETLAL